MYYFFYKISKNRYLKCKKKNTINCLHKTANMFITDLSPSCFRGRIRPCNKRRHLRQSLATTCTCLITVSLKLVSPFCSSFFLHCAPITALVFSELLYFLSFQVGAVLMFKQFLSSEHMTYQFPTLLFIKKKRKDKAILKSLNLRYCFF